MQIRGLLPGSSFHGGGFLGSEDMGTRAMVYQAGQDFQWSRVGGGFILYSDWLVFESNTNALGSTRLFRKKRWHVQSCALV